MGCLVLNDSRSYIRLVGRSRNVWAHCVHASSAPAGGWDKPEREERDETQNGIYWLLFGDKAAFDLKVDDEDDRVKLNRKMGFCCGEPVCGALYYANGVGEYDNNNERHGKHWSEKTTGSSIELSFCDSRAKETSPKAEDRATAIPTAAEVLFRLEHFLVFE